MELYGAYGNSFLRGPLDIKILKNRHKYRGEAPHIIPDPLYVAAGKYTNILGRSF